MDKSIRNNDSSLCGYFLNGERWMGVATFEEIGFRALRHTVAGQGGTSDREKNRDRMYLSVECVCVIYLSRAA